MTDDEAMDYIERNCSEPPVDDDEPEPTCPHCTAMAESARLAEDRLVRVLEGAEDARAERDRLREAAQQEAKLHARRLGRACKCRLCCALASGEESRAEEPGR